MRGTVNVKLTGLVPCGGTAVCDFDGVSSLRCGVRLVVWMLVLSFNALLNWFCVQFYNQTG
jgi:hypothetical protein